MRQEVTDDGRIVRGANTASDRLSLASARRAEGLGGDEPVPGRLLGEMQLGVRSSAVSGSTATLLGVAWELGMSGAGGVRHWRCEVLNHRGRREAQAGAVAP